MGSRKLKRGRPKKPKRYDARGRKITQIRRNAPLAWASISIAGKATSDAVVEVDRHSSLVCHFKMRMEQTDDSRFAYDVMVLLYGSMAPKFGVLREGDSVQLMNFGLAPLEYHNRTTSGVPPLACVTKPGAFFSFQPATIQSMTSRKIHEAALVARATEEEKEKEKQLFESIVTETDEPWGDISEIPPVGFLEDME